MNHLPRRRESRTPRLLDASPAVLFINGSGQEIPAYGVVRLTGAFEHGIPVVTAPDADDLFPGILLVNNRSPCPAGLWGGGTLAPVCRVLFGHGHGGSGSDSGSVDAGGGGLLGDQFGTAAGSWRLVRGHYGFTFWGDSDESGGSGSQSGSETSRSALFYRGYPAGYQVVCGADRLPHLVVPSV